MTGYPDAPLDARVELDLGGWTDVTQQALPDGVQYASITSGQSDAAQQASPASLTATWDNPDGKFSPRNASGPWFGLIRQNTRARVSVASPYGNVLRIDNAGSCSCPSSAGLNVPGDLDVRVWFDSDGWVTPGAAIPLIAKWASGTSNSWYIELIPAGSVRFWRSTTGADAAFADSSLPLPPGRLALRVTYAPATGAVTVYTAADLAGTWTQLGDVVTISGGGNIFAGTAHVSLPPEDGFAGSVYAVEIRGDSGLVASPDFTAQAAAAASFADGQGNTWTVTGPAEITDRDYRLHGELSAVNPAVDSSKANPRVQATIAGPLRRLQQGSKPPVQSAMKRAWVTRPGTLAPVAYWPCEDGSSATSFGSAVGGPPMQWDAAPQLASDTAFPGSDPLPVLNGSRWSGKVPAYGGNGNIITRFCVHLDSTLPSADALLLRMVGTGTCAIFALRYLSTGGMRFTGYPRTGAAALFDDAFALPPGRVFWFSLEMRPGSPGNVVCSVDVLAPESASAFAAPNTPTFAGIVGNALQVDVNGNGLLTNTAVGHISVQADWETMYNLQGPLDAYKGERAGTRFLRYCQENGYPARCYGAPELSQAMGPQPAGTFVDLLQEIPDADLGIMYEPRDTFALGYRTAASMYNQQPAATLSYDESNLPGDLAPADDDQNLVNDWTVSLPDGTSVRVMEDDPALQTSTVNAGSYQNTATANLASGDGQLLDNAGQRLAGSSADESRVRQVTADFGIPGAPAADLARVRPGDLVVVEVPPAVLQSGDIRQLATGATEVLGPGRAITWDCVPASPWDVSVYDDAVSGRADTGGSALAAPVTASATSLPVISSDGIGWTEDAADFPFDVNAGGERMTVTGIGAGSPASCKVGVYLNAAALGVSTWAQAAAIWQGWTGITPAVGRVYLANAYPYNADMQAMAAAGARMLISIQPDYAPVSAATLASIEAWLQALKAAGADCVIAMWSEPYYSGLTAAQYQAVYQYYGPAIRRYYPLACVFSTGSIYYNSEASYYPGDEWCDQVTVDFYCASPAVGATLDAAAAIAPSKPFGIWEFNGGTGTTGQTQAQVTAYIQYIQSYMSARSSQGLVNADLSLFNGAPGRSWLGAGTTAEAGFEGGLGTWTGAGNSSLSAATAAAHSGSGSMAITSAAAGNAQAASCTAANILTQGMPCSAGDTINGAAWFRAATAARSCQAGIGFYDAAGTSLSNIYGTAVADSTSAWTQVTVTATAPANSAYCRILIQALAAGAASEVHYADDVELRDVTGTNAVLTTTIEFGWDYRIALWQAIYTALNNTSFPQAMTVTRGVGGVAKAHSAGEDVRLWHTPRYAAL